MAKNTRKTTRTSKAPATESNAKPAPARQRSAKISKTAKPAAESGCCQGSVCETTAAERPEVVMTLNHDQIARKAYEIWVRKGMPQGRDVENWKEAERELLAGSSK